MLTGATFISKASKPLSVRNDLMVVTFLSISAYNESTLFDFTSKLIDQIAVSAFYYFF